MMCVVNNNGIVVDMNGKGIDVLVVIVGLNLVVIGVGLNDGGCLNVVLVGSD